MVELVAARNLRALVVDDEPDIVETTATLLRLHGAEVQTASNGLAAIELARASFPDIALLDLAMPGVDGFGVATALRAMPSAQEPVLVAVTGHADPPNKRRAAEAGFDLHLIKPADWGVVQQLLANVREARGLDGLRNTEERVHQAQLALMRAQMDMISTLLDLASITGETDTRQRCIAKAVNTCVVLRPYLERQADVALVAEIAGLEARAGELVNRYPVEPPKPSTELSKERAAEVAKRLNARVLDDNAPPTP